MNFFEHQDRARRSSKQLIILFTIALLVVLGMGNAALIFLEAYYEHNWIGSWQAHLALSFSLLSIILGGAFYKIHHLSKFGGISIAFELGGKIVDPETQNPRERKLLNVVEEMAIASGVGVPEVFVLSGEGINAFAAGFQTHDAIIAVSQGALKTLSRDELQGVVAHEFSHIFHGDMRLNMKTSGVLHGLMMLTSFGKRLLIPYRRSYAYSRISPYGRRNSILPIFGLGLLSIGAIGLFFGRVIQAALSRQREFLADASAVQYTRNPLGLTGALKKIGGWQEGSKIESPEATELSHFFIASPIFKRARSNWFSSHPPLVKRIQIMDPQFKGSFPEVFEIPNTDEEAAVSQLHSEKPSARLQVGDIGEVNHESLQSARSQLQQLPLFVRNACRDPLLSKAVLFSLFYDPHFEQKIKKILKEHQYLDLEASIKKTYSEVIHEQPASRLILLDLLLPSLKKLNPNQHKRILSVTHQIIEVDQAFHLKEFCFFKILRKSLNQEKKQNKKASKAKVLKSSRSLFLALSYAQQKPNEVAQQKLLELGLFETLPESAPSLSELNRALNVLENIPPKSKKRLMEALFQVAEADNILSPEELELIRAIAESLEVPVPMSSKVA